MIKVDGAQVIVDRFPDGTQNIKMPTTIFRTDATVTWLYEREEELIMLIYVKKHLDKLRCSNIQLKMPYIPNARMDRVKHDDEVFTLKFFANIINSLNFDYVSVLDPHSSVSEALIDNICVKTPELFINKVLDQVYVDSLFFPDEGAMKRYSGMAKLPYAFGVKERQWDTGKILGLNIAGDAELIKNKNILIIDDICSRGGTFYFAAKKLKELGAKDVHLYVTHCEDTIHQGELLKGDLIKSVWTTDSLFHSSHEKINTMRIEEVL